MGLPYLVKDTGSSESRAEKIENQKMLSASPAALTTSNAISVAPRWFSPPMGGRSLFPLGPRFDMTSRTFRSSFVVEAIKATRRENRTCRHVRLRKKVEGTPERPRLSVFRSNKHLHVQVIDDTKMHTLATASTMQKTLSQELDYSSGPTMEVAKKIGESIAKACLEKGITKVVFDRGGFYYHGRIQAIAEAARENGLDF